MPQGLFFTFLGEKLYASTSRVPSSRLFCSMLLLFAEHRPHLRLLRRKIDFGMRLRQRLHLRQRVGYESLMGCRRRIERPMRRCLNQARHRRSRLLRIARKETLRKFLPNIIHRLLARMQHIRSIKTIIAQIVHHQFVGWEIVHPLGETRHQRIGRQKKRRFAQLIAVRSVFPMAYRTDRQHDAQLLILGPKTRE